MGQEHSILLAIMIFLIFQNSPKQKNSLYQQFLKSVGLIGLYLHLIKIQNPFQKYRLFKYIYASTYC